VGHPRFRAAILNPGEGKANSERVAPSLPGVAGDDLASPSPPSARKGACPLFPLFLAPFSRPVPFFSSPFLRHAALSQEPQLKIDSRRAGVFRQMVRMYHDKYDLEWEDLPTECEVLYSKPRGKYIGHRWAYFLRPDFERVWEEFAQLQPFRVSFGVHHAASVGIVVAHFVETFRMKKKHATMQDEQELDLLGLWSNENEDDLKVTKVDQAVTWGTDWTAETIIRQIDKGIIQLNPKFQRRDAWTKTRKSKFIESLVLGLPVPQLILAEKMDRKGAFLVLDGKQRLLTLKQFCSDLTPAGDRLVLQDLRICSELNGVSFERFKTDPAFATQFNNFQNQPIRTIILKNWPDEDFLYTVFLRLNTEGVPLSPQELRQALHPGPFMEFIDKRTCESKPLQTLLGLKNPDFRMRDVEIAIRFYAYKNFLSEYKGNLKQFLDDTCKKLNARWAKERVELEQQFDTMEEAISVTQKIFGPKYAFRKYANGVYETRINRAVFDIMLYFFSDKKIASLAQKKPDAVKQEFQDLCTNDNAFLSALETSTKIKTVVAKRMGAWAKALHTVTKIPVSSPLKV
jgi:hypothetical protein